MSTLKQEMQVIGSNHISNELLESDCDKSGGLISNGEYAWFAAGANIILYSKQLGSVVSSRSFATNQKDKSLTITFVKELHKTENSHFLLVGCSCKSFGILFVCQLPTLTTIRCIHMPNPISYISTINNESLAQDQLCDEFKVMSTVLLVGMITGAVFAVDLRHHHIENQLRRNEIVVNESRPSKLFIIRKNEDCQEVKEMSDDSDCHLAMFINENFCIYCKKQYRDKLNFSISSLLYNEEINTVAIGYSTGHFQLWDCKVMRTIYLLKDPKCVMPVTHITFLEPSDDPNNLCYLWVIQSDNSRLPNAMMIALTYEQRTMMSNGCLSYRVYKGNGIKLEMSLRRESGIGRCISALTLCNVNLFRNETDMDEDCEIRLFAMLMEIRQNVDASPESYVFLFDINQWYKAQMPSNINHLKVSNSYASFVKLPHNVSYLDLNISDKTLRPFGYNFRNNVEELYYPSSIYFECDCLLDTEIIRFKHAGVQQEILDQLLLKNWRLLINPSLIFSQCLQTNLRPFFWDKTDDYVNYSLPDQRSFVISIIVENKIMSVLSACAEEWKNGTYVSSEATILHLVQCLWKHVMVVKQYADKLCVPLFDYSGTQLGKKNERILNHCLSQMLCVKHFLEDLHNAYGIHIINVDYSYRVYTLNLVTQYFKAVTCFLNYGLLPESNEEDPTQKIIQCDFTPLIQYAIKRRLEFGDLSLYLIDAFVSNEPKGNKLIEQWQHEGGEATKGLYPPSNVQCLLRIYLNAALSNQLKDFITIYFLIDVCSSQEIDLITANRMCNFAIEFDVENKGLNTLCRATWLLDHDMFEEAMDILASSHEWLVNDKSWDWYHWTVLKLLVYKEQYFWARFYMQLTKINLVNIDDHKFYVNLQIMNNQCFDTLIYLRARPFKEKQTLFEYFFDRCRETNRLKSLIEYLWDADEAELFFSYLKRFDDTETLTFQLLFLLQRGRHKEAIKLNQTLKASLKSNNNDALTITSLLVDGFEKNIPNIMKNDYGRLPLQSVYKKPNVVVKCMNNESKMFLMDRNKVNNLVKRQSASFTPSNSIDLFLPANNSTRKRSPIDDMICNEKRRKIDENLLSSPNANNEIVKPIEKQVLEILNTPLVEKTIASPSITSYSSILKTKFATNKQKISFSLDKTPRSSIRFSLPGNADTTVEGVDFEEVVNVQQIDNPENESFYSVNSSEANDLPNQIISERIPLTFQESHKDDFKMNISDEYEKMDISEENSCSGHEQIKIDDISENETKDEEMVLSSADECLLLTSDEEDDKEIPVSKLSPKNTSFNEDIKLLTAKSVSKDKKEILNQHFATLTPLGVDNNCPIPNIQENLSKNDKPLFNDVSTACLIQNTNSNEQRPVKKINEDIDCILLDSDSDESDILSVGSSRKKLSDDSIVSDGSVITEGNIGSDGSIILSCGTNESDGSIVLDDSIASDDGSIASEVSTDLENTRYGRIKSQRRQGGDDSYDEELEEEYIDEQEEEEEEVYDEIEEEEEEECEIEEEEECEIGEEEEVECEIEEEEEEEECEIEVKVVDKIAKNGGEIEIAEEGKEEEEEIAEDNEEEEGAEEEIATEGEVDEIVEEDDEIEIYNIDSEESEREESPKQCENIWVRNDESDSELNSEVSNESNLEHPCMDDLDQQHIKFDENEEEKIINNCGITFTGNEEMGSEYKDKRYENDNDDNKSGHVVFINQNEEEDLEDREDFERVENEEYHSDKLADISYDENFDNLEEPDEVSDVIHSEESDFIINDASDENNSEEPDVTIEIENEENLKVQNVLDDKNEEHNFEEPNGILIGENNENLEVSDFILHNEKEVHKSEEPNGSIHVGENNENLEVPNVIIDDNTNEQDSEEVHSILDDASEENSSEEPDILDVASDENSSERPDVSLNVGSEENNSEEPDVTIETENEENLKVQNVLDDKNEEHNFEEPNGILIGENNENLGVSDVILHNEKEVHKSEEPNGSIHVGESNENLEVPNVIIDDNTNEQDSEEVHSILDDASEENSSEEPDILDVASDENSSERPDVSLNVGSEENNSEEPDVTIETENEENLKVQNVLDDKNEEHNFEEPNGILIGENNENLGVSDVILHNEKEVHKSEEPNGSIHVGESNENLEVPNVIIDDNTNEQDSEEVHSILDDASEENSSEEPDILDVASEENSSEEPDVLDVASDENSSERPDVSLNVGSEENNSEVLEYASEQNSFKGTNVILDDESTANNLKLLKTLKNEKTSENNELVDSNKIVYPIDSQSNSSENLTPRLYNVAQETHSNDNNQICDEENENSRSIITEDDNDSCVVEDNENVIEVVENTDKVNEPMNLDDIENNKDDLSIDQNEDNHCDEYTSANNDHSFEMFRNESNPIPDDGFNHLTMPGVEADQLEMDVNQSTPFMFGESFFGQQETPEKKPMLLFGHLYSFENEQLNVDVQADKLETQESDMVNSGVDITNKEPEVEIEGEIQDILELESLPESNPDDNFDTQNDTDSNKLQPECKEFKETFHDNGQTVLSSDSPHLKPIYFGNIDSVQIFENNEQTPSTSIDLSKKSVELKNKDLTSNECCDLLKIKQANPSIPNESEEQICKTDTVPTNTVENYTTNSVNTMESEKSSYVVEDDEKICPISQRSITTTSEPIQLMDINIQDANSKCATSVVSYSSNIDQFNDFSDNDQLLKNQNINENINTSLNNEEIESHQSVKLNIQDAEEVQSKCATSVMSCSLNIDQFDDIGDNDQLLKKININENINTSLNNEEIESHQPAKSVQKCIELETTIETVGPHCADASVKIQNVANENKISLAENIAELGKCCQKSSLNIPRIENYSLRSSSRRSISKTTECLLDIPSTTEQKLTLNKTKLLSDPIQENKTIVIDQIKKAKSIPSVDITPITTRSRAKSEPKQIQLDPISSNIFRSSGMVEDNSRQVRVSLSKKRSKSQENMSSIKRRSGRSKSLAPAENSEANKRKTVFGLEEIPEEDTPNTDTNIIKTERTALKKKPKFNFLSNSSKKIEYVNLTPKCQQDTKIRTPRRSKSLQPDPVLTFSVVKTKPKRSSSVNMLISNDEIPTEKDDLMGVLKKALNPPEKVRKRSVTESLRSRKKQKIQNQVEEVKKEVAGSKYNSNESNQSYQISNSSYSSEQLSPIVGNISQHMLYTPAKKRTKIRMNLDSENEYSSSDQSTDSNRIMTRSMIQNSSIVELDPIHRTLKSEIRPSKVPINRPRRRSSSVSSIPEIKTPKKSASSVFEKNELLFSKRKAKHNIKEPIVHAPIEPSIEPPSTSERRITRFQQSILDKSLQSTSVIGQDTSTNNITVPKPEKKKLLKKTNLKKKN